MGTGSPFSSLLPTHELPDDRNNPEHYEQVRDADGNDKEDGEPSGRPGHEKNQRDMKSRETDHGPPKPRVPPKLPSHGDGDGNHRSRCKRRTCKGQLSEVVEQVQHRQRAQNDAQNTPPRQLHLPIFFGEYFVY